METSWFFPFSAVREGCGQGSTSREAWWTGAWKERAPDANVDYLVAPPTRATGVRDGLSPRCAYWRTFEPVEEFAKDKDDPHLDDGRRYLRPRVGRTAATASGNLGRTYLVKRGTVRGRSNMASRAAWAKR